MDFDSDIRNKIIIIYSERTKRYSNIILAAIYSNNENNFKIFKKLLKINKSIEIINKVLVASIYDSKNLNIEVIKLLIKYGADVMCRDEYNNIIFMVCFYQVITDIEIIELFIENGANVNNIDDYGKTSLMLIVTNSSTYDHIEIIKLLIRKGVKINRKTNDSDTALMLCFYSNYNNQIKLEIIKLLLDNKADIYIKDYFNRNILDIIIHEIGSCKQNCKFSDIYSLIFNYKNLKDDHLCEFDIDFIYNL